MDTKKGLILVLATALISGFSIFINKFGVKGINSDIYAFSRSLLVALMLVAIILVTRSYGELKSLRKKDWLKLSVVGLVGGSIPFLLFFRGLQLTSSAAGSFIQKTMFVFVAVSAIFFLKEKLNKGIIFAGGLLLAGNLLFLKLAINDLALSQGNMLILAATLFWAAENTMSKHLLKHISGNVLAFGRMGFGAIFIFIYLAFTRELVLMQGITASQLGWITVTSPVLLGYVLTWYNGLRHIKATTATCILLLGSPITTMLDYFWGTVTLSPQQVIGSLMILSGVAFAVIALEKTEMHQSAISTANP